MLTHLLASPLMAQAHSFQSASPMTLSLSAFHRLLNLLRPFGSLATMLDLQGGATRQQPLHARRYAALAHAHPIRHEC